MDLLEIYFSNTRMLIVVHILDNLHSVMYSHFKIMVIACMELNRFLQLLHIALI
jgi:hypothetical protein